MKAAFLLVCLLLAHVPLRAHNAPYTHFEARHTHSIGLTPDGTRLLAVNTSDARLSVFDVSNAANPAPVLIDEIPVGLEPISLRARTDDEVWVVSEVGDSVAIVSLSRGAVIDTLRTPDEPADVVFAQGKAFVSCARSNSIRVFDATTRQELAPIAVEGLMPRALATDPAGTKVFAAFLLSGNGTTILRASQAPAPPPPTNAALPPAPQTALIVAANDPRIAFNVFDRDVAEIDVVSGQVTRYVSGAGTNLFDLAVHPQTGDVWAANTEARNLVRFEPALRGHIADHRLTRLSVSGAPAIYDLNPGIDYNVLPNATAQAQALAQPTAIVFSADGATAWVAAFASDRVAKVSSTGQVLQRINVRTPIVFGTSHEMRGPRALALHEARQRLYVLNKLANSITVIATATGSVLREVPAGSYDQTPLDVKAGRGFLFDARLSGNGTASCATCHLDADVDGLAWDLGDPGGDMVTVMGRNLSGGGQTPQPRNMHPMKGPMLTQTLRSLFEGAPFHWRGDRPTLQSFNPTFDKLMGGAQISAGDMNLLADYLSTLRHHPNPNRQRDGTLPPTFAGGDPIRGAALFRSEETHCTTCHAGMNEGVDDHHSDARNNIDLHAIIGAEQPVKNPLLATVYQRTFFRPQAGQTSLSGFGLLHDGSGSSLPAVHADPFDGLATAADFADVKAFVLCADTATAPAVGDSRTVTPLNRDAADVLADLARLEAECVEGACDLVVRGVVNGRRRSFLFARVGQLYYSDVAREAPLTRAALLALLGPQDALTFLGAMSGEGERFGGNRDGNAIRDGDEPRPHLDMYEIGGVQLRLEWAFPSIGWRLEVAEHLEGPWLQITDALPRTFDTFYRDYTMNAPTGFFRLRRTW